MKKSSLINRRNLFIGATASLFLPTETLAQQYVRTSPNARITHLIVKKSTRELLLMHNNKVVNDYRIQLGNNPSGHKIKQGDGRTPEGLYTITHKNPRSNFYLSIGISYPNAKDKYRARQRGVNPGGDIFLHGRGPRAQRGNDWTRGCIAVEDIEIQRIYREIQPGTPIKILL